ncbi:MAG: lysine--tRNA ligase, partial [Rhodococcus sp.]|nr:lysine--tRNA ligase [Rhodococcus sp. (in: high G+C Gram-positive bacteria)]
MAPLTEVSDTTAELVESPPENPRQARRFRKGRFSQVPHISGLILGVFSVLVFLWSISPVLRHILRVPREYIDSYYFDAPDTSLSWALVVALLAAALASRKRIAWWLLTIYLSLITLT